MRAIAILCLALLAACGPTRLEREQALNRLVGLSEAEVVSQLGLPARLHEAGGVRFLAYEERHLHHAAGYAAGYYGGPHRFGGWWGHHPWHGGWYGVGMVAVPPPMVERVCVSTLEVAGGLVRRVSVRGDGCWP